MSRDDHLLPSSTRGPSRREVLFVVVLSLLTVLEIATNKHRHGPLGPNLALGCVFAIPLLWRHRHPLLVTAWFLVLACVMTKWLTGPPDLFSLVVVLVITAYTVGAELPLRRAGAGMVLLALGIWAISILSSDAGDIAFPVLFFGGAPWLAGRAVRARRRLAAGLEETAERIEAEREERERLAVLEERTRIARELHDVVAHNVSLMVVQASAAAAHCGDRSRPRRRRGRGDRALRARGAGRDAPGARRAAARRRRRLRWRRSPGSRSCRPRAPGARAPASTLNCAARAMSSPCRPASTSPRTASSRRR